MLHGARITSIGEAKVLDLRGNIQRTRVVEFMVGEDGPFTLQLPEAEFTVERVQQLVTEKAQAILQLRGG